MPCKCQCPKCQLCYDDDATRRCQEEVAATALVATMRTTPSSRQLQVAVFCPACNLWFYCDCQET